MEISAHYSACLFLPWLAEGNRTTVLREAESTLMDAAYLFNKGENYMSYKFLGAHPYEDENGKGFIFRVWAPNARMVSVMNMGTEGSGSPAVGPL